jgi:hypothetical protein
VCDELEVLVASDLAASAGIRRMAIAWIRSSHPMLRRGIR